MPAGVQMDLSFKNTSAVIANLYAFDADVQVAVINLVRRAGEFCRELTFYFSPVDTTFMRNHIRVTFGPKGYSFEVGWLEDDFLSAGLAFYPLYQEFGTRFMHAQPSLTPAYEETREWFLPELTAEIRRAAARRSSR
jgi:HK97 gp10 family phage protein